MQGPKSILVPLDASPSARERLATANALARRHGGVVLGMYAGARRHALRPPRIEHLHHRDGYDADRHHDVRHQVQAWFDGETRRADRPAMQWLEADANNLDDALARQVLLADLVVLGSRNDDEPDAPGRGFTERILISSGKPGLVLPTGMCSSLPRHRPATILLAWDGRPAASRAMASALPLIAQADALHTIEPCGALDEREVDRFDLRRYLAAHGVNPVRHHHRHDDDEAADAILALAADVGADLIVMGCYGHGRMREFLLGGTTRSMLRKTRVPLWMTH